MAAVASLGVTFNTTAGNKTVTAIPTANDLIVIVAAASGTSGANAATTAVSDNNSDGLGAYTLADDSGAAAGSPRITVWVRNALVGSATSTIFTATQANSNGGGLEVYRVSGMTRAGAQAERGSGHNSGASGTTPAVTLPQAALTGNPCISGVSNGTSPGGVTGPASWTRSNDLGYSTPTTGLDDAFINSGFTGSTVTWGSTSASAWVAVALELDTSALPSNVAMFCGEEEVA